MGAAHRPDAARLVREPVEPEPQAHRHRRRRATIRERADQAGDARPLLVVDNTFASPALQNPLELGADIVFHSATKYLGGHSDTILGIAVTRDDAIAERLRFLQNAMGGVPGPLDCFLVLRGLRTLHLRVERHVANATAIAPFLAARDDVERVFYPGLADGPACPSRRPRSSARAARCAAAAGWSRSSRGRRPARRGRAADRAIAIAESTRLFTLAESLGGVESLVEVPATMTHASVAGSHARGRPGAGPPVGRDRARRRPDRATSRRAARPQPDAVRRARALADPGEA